MAPVTVKNKVNPLTYNVPIVSKDGSPTYEFQVKWLQQAHANAAVVDLTTAKNVSAVLDLIGSGKGSILYRGTLQWNTLSGAAGHDGWVLTWNDTTGLAEWRAVASGGGAASSFYLDGTDGYVALVDSNGQLVLDSLGRGIYSKDPVLPAAMIPVGSAAQFGAFKVDNTTITAVAGILAAAQLPAVYGFFSGRGNNQSVSDGVWTPMKPDVISFDTTGGLNGTTGVWTPPKAGKYLVFACVQGGAATSVQSTNVRLSKNGTIGSGGVAQASANYQGGTTISGTCFVAAIVPMNGTTDTLEADCLISATGGSDVLEGGGPGLIAVTYFAAVFIGT